MTPYLIQRGKIRREPSRKGLDGFVAFDYMGSSEFEFGALNKSLKAIRAEIKFYQHQVIYFPDAGPVLIFAKDVTETLDLIKGIGWNHFRLKERCDFFDWCNPSAPYAQKKENRNNFWWDIENHFMFWLSQPNDQEILQAIQGKL